MILEVLEEAGASLEGLTEGLPVTLPELMDPRARVDWDVWAELLERIDARSPITVEQIGERMARVPSFVLRRLARLVMSPRQLYTIGFRLVAPAMFANVVVRHEWLASGRLVAVGELAPGYRPCATFFRLCHANVAATPLALGLPASTIEEQTCSGHRGRLVLLPPASNALDVRVRQVARVLLGIPGAWRVIAEQQRELEASVSALRSSRHELQQLLEHLPDGVVIHRGGVICWSNAALARIFGLRRAEEAIGRQLLDFVPVEDREALLVEMRRAAASEVDPSSREYRVQRADGTLRRVQSGTTQIVDYQGAQARLVVLRDVTEQHRMREQAAIADRFASIGALAAGVAHEINNPLGYVRLNLEMASRHGAAQSPELQASLALAREGTDHALDIVRDLTMLARADREVNAPVDLPALLDSTLALANGAIASKARIERRYEPTPPVLAPRGKLAQVFLNLLSNAADAIPDGSPSSHVISARTYTDARGRALVEIRDSGCGVAPEIGDRVFDPFFTTKPLGAGTGLGLAICHRIVTELEGEITFESAPGATTFRVMLPPTAR
ncbi:MAG TPA: ATP-binding protein [Polyangiaceae bacterium]